MRNIKKLILIFIPMAIFVAKGMDNPFVLDSFADCLIAFTCTGEFESYDSLAYKTGPDTSICFGILSKKQTTKKQEDCYSRKYLYKLHLLTKAKLAHNLPSCIKNEECFSGGPSQMRKVTAHERELVKKAIRHNGARFWDIKTDGDSLQLWESSK